MLSSPRVSLEFQLFSEMKKRGYKVGKQGFCVFVPHNSFGAKQQKSVNPEMIISAVVSPH